MHFRVIFLPLRSSIVQSCVLVPVLVQSIVAILLLPSNISHAQLPSTALLHFSVLTVPPFESFTVHIVVLVSLFRPLQLIVVVEPSGPVRVHGPSSQL